MEIDLLLSMLKFFMSSWLDAAICWRISNNDPLGLGLAFVKIFVGNFLNEGFVT